MDFTFENIAQRKSGAMDISTQSPRQDQSTHWPTKKLGAAAIIRDADGCVLLVKHNYGMHNWEIPGGAVEENESVADAAVREVFEETGLRVGVERLTGIYYVAENDSHHFVFLCSVADGQQSVSPDHVEISECRYYSPAALPRPISDFTVGRIRDALAESGSLLPQPVEPRVWLE